MNALTEFNIEIAIESTVSTNSNTWVHHLQSLAPMQSLQFR
jgi:hypothetical protein